MNSRKIYKQSSRAIFKKERYDFDYLVKKHVYMNDEEILQEYAKVYNQLFKLNRDLTQNVITEEEYFYYLEPLQDSEIYLARYIALKHMSDKGYTITVHGEII